jgi:hypothetical protein
MSSRDAFGLDEGMSASIVEIDNVLPRVVAG